MLDNNTHYNLQFLWLRAWMSWLIRALWFILNSTQNGNYAHQGCLLQLWWLTESFTSQRLLVGNACSAFLFSVHKYSLDMQIIVYITLCRILTFVCWPHFSFSDLHRYAWFPICQYTISDFRYSVYPFLSSCWATIFTICPHTILLLVHFSCWSLMEAKTTSRLCSHRINISLLHPSFK